MLIGDPGRFDGVQVIGVDEHAWRHTRRGDKYVTVIIDLTPIRDGTGPPGCWTWSRAAPSRRSSSGLPTPPAWRDGVEVVAMDGFTGFKTAAAEEIPDAVAVMDPFHVVRLAGDALDRCRRRVQLPSTATAAARRPALRRPADPAHRRRPAHRRQQRRLTALFADDAHVEVEATWGIYQRMIAAYRNPDRRAARADAAADRLRQPRRSRALSEIITLGRTLKKRAVDMLAYFDRPGTSNGPTEAINGRLEHLRGSALGFRNLTNYIARSLLETGGFRPYYTLDCEEPD